MGVLLSKELFCMGVLLNGYEMGVLGCLIMLLSGGIGR